MFTNGDKSVHPPMMELDYSNFKWSEDEIDEIHKYAIKFKKNVDLNLFYHLKVMKQD